MVKLIKSVGTGMTREGIVSFDWDEPGDVEAQINAAVETWNRSNLACTGCHSAVHFPSTNMTLSSIG